MSEARDNSNSCFLLSHSKLPLTHLQSCTAVSSSSNQSHQRSPSHSPASPRPRTFSCLAFVHFFFTDHQLNCFCLLDNFIHFYFNFAFALSMPSIYSSICNLKEQNAAQKKIKYGLVSRCRASRDDITKFRIAVAAFYFIDQIKHKQLTLLAYFYSKTQAKSNQKFHFRK